MASVFFNPPNEDGKIRTTDGRFVGEFLRADGKLTGIAVVDTVTDDGAFVLDLAAARRWAADQIERGV